LNLTLGLSQPALAAKVQQPGAAASPSAVPNAMPVISRNVPAYTNDDCGGATPASKANDNIYDDGWKSCTTPSASAPTYLAYDLSGVPVAQRGQVLVVWYNDPATLVYDYTFRSSVNPYPPGCTTNCGWSPYDIPRNYTLEANAAPGGTLPSSGWVTLATVTGNNYHSRQHAVNLTGYNWVRINVTAVNGVQNATFVVLNMDIHNASAGYQDDWIFYGDSITEGSMHHAGGGGSFGQQINAKLPSRFPAQEAGSIGGTLSVDGKNTINTWLAMFSGQYVVMAYGTNDAGFDTPYATFYNNYVTMVQAVLALGKTPLIPHIPWGCTSQIQLNVPHLNQQIDALYSAFPQIVRGPDLWAFFQANQGLIGPDCIHPTDAGYAAMRQQWVNTAMATVYAPPPALQISAVQVGSITTTSAVVTWQTSNAANSRVDYGTTTAYDNSAIDAANVTSHSLTLNGLTPNTLYHYQVSSTDTNGQTATSPDGTFTTLPLGQTATRFALATTASPNSGVPFSFTVTAQDDAGNIASGYSGTVHFTSTDAAAGVQLPADATLANGQGTFSATLITAGSQTITATDTVTSTITGIVSVTVIGPASRFALATTASPTAGAAFSFTVTAQDAAGRTATAYNGTVHFTSTDVSAGVKLPADTKLTNGQGTFSATLTKAGAQTITATDTVTSTITGMVSVTVRAASAATMTLDVPSTVTALAPFNVKLTLKDSFGNVATGYLGTVTFSSSDPLASLPADYKFTSTDAGVRTFSVTLATPPAQTISVHDIANSSLGTTSRPITVTLPLPGL
jgi:lysophospholipase L1-like esterase